MSVVGVVAAVEVVAAEVVVGGALGENVPDDHDQGVRDREDGSEDGLADLYLEGGQLAVNKNLTLTKTIYYNSDTTVDIQTGAVLKYTGDRNDRNWHPSDHCITQWNGCSLKQSFGPELFKSQFPTQCRRWLQKKPARVARYLMHPKIDYAA